MKKNTKLFLKQMYTMLIHPMVSFDLIVKGTRYFNIGPRMKINKLKYYQLGDYVAIGSDSRFLFVHTYFGGRYDPSLSIGDNSSIGNRFSVLCAAPIIIGENALIASDVLITSENHGIDVELSNSYNNIPLHVKAVKIGKGCWIGEKAIILPGVELGDRCIVAAGGVVNKSFPAYSMVAGVPAKLIKKYNFDTHQWEKV